MYQRVVLFGQRVIITYRDQKTKVQKSVGSLSLTKTPVSPGKLSH